MYYRDLFLADVLPQHPPSAEWFTGPKSMRRKRLEPQCVMDFMLGAALSVSDKSDTPLCLLEDGNCIPCAIFHLVPDKREVLSHWVKNNPVPSGNRRRTYGEVCAATGVLLNPIHPTVTEAPPLGQYLLHVGGIASSHCVAIAFTQGGWPLSETALLTRVSRQPGS
jgi:hypothetical protein